MSIDRILPYYVGGCIVSLFTGIAYETETLVLRPFDVMIGVALIFTVAAAASRGYARRFDKGLPYYLFAALYLYRGLSGLVMTGPVLAVKELIQGFEFLVLIHLVAQAVKVKDNRMRFLKTLYTGFGVVAVGTALLHVWEGQYSGYKYLAELGYTSGGAAKYAFGLFGLMAAVFWASDQGGGYTFPVLGLAILLAFLSEERKGWMALAAAAASLYYVASNLRVWNALKNLFRARSIAVAMLLITTVSIAYGYGYSRASLESIENTYSIVVDSEFEYASKRGQRDVSRYNGLVFTMDALSRRPMFGVGTESSKEALDKIPNPGVRITTGHGEYQRYALENGLIGLLAYMIMWLLILVTSLRFSVNFSRKDYISSIFIVGFVFYSVTVNMFMGGGAHNLLFVSVSIGFLYAVKYQNK